MTKSPRVSPLKVAFCSLLNLFDLFLKSARDLLKHLWVTEGRGFFCPQACDDTEWGRNR